MEHPSSINDHEMHVKQGYFLKRWRKAKTEILSSFLAKYRRCVLQLKKCLHESSRTDNERRKSHAKLHPLPDRPIRRVASKLGRKPTNELERLRKKGEDWNANDLFRFQYSDPESGTPEERRTLCFEWLDRLQAITKKYCYLAWYESAIYACYYRLAPILYDVEEKKRIWMDVKREYAEIFMMGRRIWRRPIHPSRLRVFYDMAMLCVRFGQIENDSTIMLFRDSLEDANNFDFKVLSEVEFAKSIDKISRLENHIIDQFYLRRRSSGSVRSSFRTRRNTDRSPSRRSENEDDSGEQPSTSVAQLEEDDPLSSSIEAISLAFDETTSHERPKSILIPSIVIQGTSRKNSVVPPSSPRPAVHFDKLNDYT